MNNKPSLSSTFKLFLDGPSQLGELLLKAGWITQVQLDEISKATGSVPGRIGQMLVMAGYISHVDLQNALQVQCLVREKIIDKQTGVQAMRLTRFKHIDLKDALTSIQSDECSEPSTRLGDLLIEAGILSTDELDEALICNQSSGLPLGRVLVLSGFLTDQLLLAALNAQMVLRQGAIERKDAIRAIAAASQKAPAPVPITPPMVPADERETLVRPSRDSFIEKLLIGSGIITEEQFSNAMKLAFEQKCDAGTMLLKLKIIDSATLGMAREMQKLVNENFLEPEWCVQSLRQAFQERDSKGDAGESAPPSATESGQAAKSPEQTSAPREVDLPDFLVLCKVTSREAIERAQKMCAGTQFDIPSALVRTNAASQPVIALANQCFQLVAKDEMTLDEAVFAFDYCNRQVNEKDVQLLHATEMLAFQTGIWALHDALNTP